MPSMRHSSPSRGCYGRLMIRGPSIEEDEGEAHAENQSRHASRTSHSEDNSANHEGSNVAQENPQGGLFPQSVKILVRNAAVFLLTNILVSITLIVVGIVISCGLGYFSFFKLKPRPVIDKSIKAFNIPNHIASRRQDALNVAIQDLSKRYRGRRDLRHFYDTSFDEQLHQNIFPEDNSLDRDVSFDIFVDSKSGPHIKTLTGIDLKNRVSKMVEKMYSEGEEQEKLATSHSQGRHKRELASDVRIKGITQGNRRWKMQIVYVAQGDEEKNIFTEDRIRTIHEIEKAVREHKQYTSFCYINYHKWSMDKNLDRYGGCIPLNSLLTYFYPSKTEDGMVHYDGLGSVMDKIERTLKFAMTHDTFFWYVDDKINSTYLRSKILRTEVPFGAPLPGYMSYQDRKEEQHKKYVNFVITYISMLSKLSTNKVRVLYGGNEIFDYEVDSTFWSDLQLALFTLAFIVIFMFVLTSFSLWLTFWGMVSILLSFPLALFFYRFLFKVTTLGILNGAAAFVIIGIGVDDVFVFVNTFRQAYYLEDLGDRMLHTVRTAGKATFFTSFTTSAAFAANVASSIPAVHDFGLFMSLIVGCCWLMVITMMPPVINIWARYISVCETRCFSLLPTLKLSVLEMPSDIVNFLSAGGRKQQRRVETTPPGENDDVPMLQMEDVNDHEEMLYDDDDPLLQLENDLEEETSTEEQESAKLRQKGCGLTSKLQGIIFHCVAKPVVKNRKKIFVIYVILLIISMGLMTQITPATKPPQLFKSDTNLQMLLDLAANFSDSGITCDECSAFYKEDAVPLPKITPPKPIAPKMGSTASKETTTQHQTSAAIETPHHSQQPDGTTIETQGQNPAHNTHPETETPAIETTSKTSTTTTTTPTPRPPPAQPKHTDAPRLVLPPGLNPRPPTPTPTDPTSVGEDYDPCANGKCNNIKARPNLELGAVVYVVFGIKDIDRSNVSYKHVLTDKGQVIYDKKFQNHFKITATTELEDLAIRDLCRVCKVIANNTKLVKPNSSQCLPQYGLGAEIRNHLKKYSECRDLPENKISVNGRSMPARAIVSGTDSGIQWIAFAFESTTYKGQSYFTAYKEYQEWETFMDHIRSHVLPPDSPLKSVYQTSDFWENVMMEIVAVSSAIYGLVLSMIICVTAVAVFTGHLVLLLIIMATIIGVICLVVAIFFIAGWEMGAVEAVSLSILVGSSVDYCLHIVEGYLLAGRNPPEGALQSPGHCRRWRTLAATSHIGVSITSSAITTIVAAIPLTMTSIQPFAKFGQIVTINTTISIFYTLTACVAFLSLFAPAAYVNSLRSTSTALVATLIFVGGLVLTLYIISRCGVDIPAPNGENLFPK